MINIDYLWNCTNPNDWETALDYYFNFVKPSNIDIEKELDNLDFNTVKDMNVEQFYDFLHDKFFVWKYTQPNRLKTTRTCLEKYLKDDNLFELEEIHHLMFKYDLDDIKNCLRNAQRIRGLGISGASGLLSLLFPKHFGTVDQFVVLRLLDIKDYDKHSDIAKINPLGLTLNDGVFLIRILRDKARELNKKFHTEKWTPRKIDKVLWCIGR